MAEHTIRLIDEAEAALNQAKVITGLNKADVINRALQVYAGLESAFEVTGRVTVARDDINYFRFIVET